MNERRNLFVGAAEDLRNPTRVIRVSCRKPHKGSGGYFLFLLRHSVCFSVTVWITPLSSSFSRSLSSVRR